MEGVCRVSSKGMWPSSPQDQRGDPRSPAFPSSFSHGGQGLQHAADRITVASLEVQGIGEIDDPRSPMAFGEPASNFAPRKFARGGDLSARPELRTRTIDGCPLHHSGRRLSRPFPGSGGRMRRTIQPPSEWSEEMRVQFRRWRRNRSSTLDKSGDSGKYRSAVLVRAPEAEQIEGDDPMRARKCIEAEGSRPAHAHGRGRAAAPDQCRRNFPAEHRRLRAAAEASSSTNLRGGVDIWLTL